MVRASFCLTFLMIISAFLAACGNGGNGNSSLVPAAPVGVAATSGDAGVTITWDAVPGATSYNVYYSNAPGVNYTNGTKLSSITSPYVHTNLNNGNAYYYVITAENKNGESAVSTEASAFPRHIAWRQINSGLTSLFVSSLAINPADPQTLYAATLGGGVFKTTDRGNSWSAASYNGSLLVNSVMLAPTNPQTVYAAAFGGIFTSTNGGGTWSPINHGLPSSIIVGTFAIDPTNPQVLYAGADNGIDSVDGLFKSVDGGSTWSAIGSGLNTPPFINAITVDSINPQIVYVATSTGIYKSVNGGEMWAASGLPGSKILSMAINPTDPRILYAGIYSGDGTRGGLYMSTDSGGTWTNIGFMSQTVGSLVIDPTNSHIIYAVAASLGGYDGGVYRSTNGGITWFKVSNGLIENLPNSMPHQLAIDPTNPQIIYAATNAGVYATN